MVATPGLDSGLRLLSDPDFAMRTSTYLTTYTLVSGLLTTSTYQAFYTNISSDTSWAPGAFRLANGISFAFSLACILVSSGAILILNSVVPGARALRFRAWPARYLALGMTWSYIFLAVSILAAVAAYGVAAWALFLSEVWWQKFVSVIMGGATTIGALVYLLLFVCAPSVMTVSDHSKPKYHLDDEIKAIVATNVMIWIKDQRLADNVRLIEELKEDGLLKILDACRKDYRAFKPNAVMPSALFSPWALAECMVTQMGIAAVLGSSAGSGTDHKLLTVGQAIVFCRLAIKKVEPEPALSVLRALGWDLSLPAAGGWLG